jgi:short-subunit dehydrogenase
MRNIIIFGASRGLGNSIVDGIAKEGDKFYLISRTEPQNLRAKSNFEKIWIKSDLSDLRSIQKVYISLKGIPIDIFLYNAGIWEEGEFEKISQL